MDTETPLLFLPLGIFLVWWAVVAGRVRTPEGRVLALTILTACVGLYLLGVFVVADYSCAWEGFEGGWTLDGKMPLECRR